MAEQTKTQQRLMELRSLVEKLQTSDGWQEWLNTRAKFHKYSWRNQVLIQLQRPDATIVRGFNQWRNDFHRIVRKGEKGIWILRPELVKAKDPQGQPILKDGRPEMALRFRPQVVFDVAQTDPIDGLPVVSLEPPIRSVSGDESEQLCLQLANWAITHNHAKRIEYEAMGPNTGGYYSVTSSVIVLNQAKPWNQKLGTLIHELAHALEDRLPPAERDYEYQELIAEAVAWSCCQHVGVDRGEFSAGYILSWEREAPQKLMTAAAEIDRRCRIIEQGLESCQAEVMA